MFYNGSILYMVIRAVLILLLKILNLLRILELLMKLKNKEMIQEIKTELQIIRLEDN